MAYPLETILAEKRDVCDADTLGRALAATCSKRNSESVKRDRTRTISAMRESEDLSRQWRNHGSKHSYAKGIGFLDTLQAVQEAADASEASFVSSLVGQASVPPGSCATSS